MTDLSVFFTKKVAASMAKTEAPIDIVTTVNETIETLLSVKNSPPGTEVLIPEKRIFEICKVATIIFLKQPILLELSAPIMVAGDIHGQFADLLRLFEVGGFPPKTNYLFLGDYVDRAKQSTETLLLLLCYKIKYARSFFMLRGNHECALLNKIYGFYDECKRRYSVKVWKAFTDVFNALPIAAVIEDQIFCAHGGISPELNHLSDVFAVQRPTEVKESGAIADCLTCLYFVLLNFAFVSGLLCDFLWSDPDMDDGNPGWVKSPRGISYMFGVDVIEQFLQSHNLSMICRAHQVVEDGYEFHANRKLVTIFSAPNYCGEFDNAGAIMVVDANMVCSFRILRPESHKFKFPDLYPEYAFSDNTGDCDDHDMDHVQDHITTSTTNETDSERESSVASLDSDDTTLAIPSDFESFTRAMPDLKLTYEDYIKIVDAKNNKKYA